jgi:SAM-dependent methyltransferase
MKLSEIIAYKNLLEGITPLNSTPLVHEILNPVLKVIENNEIQFQYLTQQLQENYHCVHRTLNDFENTIENIKISILKLIEQQEKSYYSNCADLYTTSTNFETTEYILNRKLPVFKEVVGQLVTRIQSLNNWQHAGMIIRPGHEEWIKYLVGCDPLYLVDYSDELIEPAVLRFNDQYQRRLRTYVIQESSHAPMFSCIPDAQLGVCLVWNFFNYKPIDIIEQYLKELYNKLKPGGTLALTFNNCDRAAGTELFERHFMSYTPEREVLARAEAIGYIVTYNFRTDSSNTWLELQRPGQLSSIKGGQSLATVIDPADEIRKQQDEIRKQQDEIRKQQEQQLRNEELRKDAKNLNITDWETLPIDELKLLIRQKEQVIFETEQKIRREAQHLKISEWETLPMDELKQKMQAAYDLNEINELRKKAIRLQLDRTERILSSKYYPLEKLRELINQWRKTQ